MNICQTTYIFLIQFSMNSYKSIVKINYISCRSLCVVGLSGLEPPTSRLSGVRSNQLSYKPISLASLPPQARGGDEEDRTPDPLRARQVLSQLSYTPMHSTRRCF